MTSADEEEEKGVSYIRRRVKRLPEEALNLCRGGAGRTARILRVLVSRACLFLPILLRVARAYVAGARAKQRWLAFPRGRSRAPRVNRTRTVLQQRACATTVSAGAACFFTLRTAVLPRPAGNSSQLGPGFGCGCSFLHTIHTQLLISLGALFLFRNLTALSTRCVAPLGLYVFVSLVFSDFGRAVAAATVPSTRGRRSGG